MKKNSILILIAISIFSLWNCEEKLQIPQPVYSNFLPSHEGNWWLYKIDTNTQLTDTLFATKFDTIVSNKTYKIFKTKNFNDLKYLRQSGNSYYQLGANYIGMPDTLYRQLDSLSNYDFLYFKSDANEGETWSNEFVPNQINKIRVLSKVLNKNITVTITDKKFENVTSVLYKVQIKYFNKNFPVDFPWEDVNVPEYISYFKEGIGQVGDNKNVVLVDYKILK
ncbi:MAG: hypothetical protein RLZZ175_199 [Bacteroidota bacterium]|jgi:hypothetical protein